MSSNQEMSINMSNLMGVLSRYKDPNLLQADQRTQQKCQSTAQEAGRRPGRKPRRPPPIDPKELLREQITQANTENFELRDSNVRLQRFCRTQEAKKRELKHRVSLLEQKKEKDIEDRRTIEELEGVVEQKLHQISELKFEIEAVQTRLQGNPGPGTWKLSNSTSARISRSAESYKKPSGGARRVPNIGSMGDLFKNVSGAKKGCDMGSIESLKKPSGRTIRESNNGSMARGSRSEESFKKPFRGVRRGSDIGSLADLNKNVSGAKTGCDMGPIAEVSFKKQSGGAKRKSYAGSMTKSSRSEKSYKKPPGGVRKGSDIGTLADLYKKVSEVKTGCGMGSIAEKAVQSSDENTMWTRLPDDPNSGTWKLSNSTPARISRSAESYNKPTGGTRRGSDIGSLADLYKKVSGDKTSCDMESISLGSFQKTSRGPKLESYTGSMSVSGGGDKKRSDTGSLAELYKNISVGSKTCSESTAGGFYTESTGETTKKDSNMGSVLSKLSGLLDELDDFCISDFANCKGFLEDAQNRIRNLLVRANGGTEDFSDVVSGDYGKRVKVEIYECFDKGVQVEMGDSPIKHFQL